MAHSSHAKEAKGFRRAAHVVKHLCPLVVGTALAAEEGKEDANS